MTRETKIGLLVGLAFIIVIGILLSDQFTRQNEVPQANITVVGAKVREGNGIFNSSNPPAAAEAPNVTLNHPVPTVDEAQHQQRGGGVEVSVGPGGNGPRVHTSLQAPVTQRQDAPDRGAEISVAGPTDDPRGQSSAPAPDAAGGNSRGNAKASGDSRAVVPLPGDNLRRVAQQAGVEIVEVNPRHARDDGYAATPSVGHGSASHGRTDGGETQEIEAAAGDSLSRLASKYMGGNTKANRDAILRANPSLQQDPNRIIAGRKYVIPPAAVAAVVPDTAIETGAAAAPAAHRAAPATSPEYFYVVQPGDSLIRIASEQLGDPKAYIAIKELNKETLKGGEVVIPNMKLRLPAKPIASGQ